MNLLSIPSSRKSHSDDFDQWFFPRKDLLDGKRENVDELYNVSLSSRSQINTSSRPVGGQLLLLALHTAKKWLATN